MYIYHAVKFIEVMFKYTTHKFKTSVNFWNQTKRPMIKHLKLIRQRVKKGQLCN